ncbi:hypothetical protein [Dyadobacter tibetensis]|uniref:hypothetical protein n=1 Tax=Dyadobacter tibetensis TaxID=1211851 RepID=UPI000470A573|nr:hypothetical protein [Dyadobacter tibetensis]
MMLFAFSIAHAEEVKEEKVVIKEVATPVLAVSPSVAVFMPECYALTCQTYCQEGPVTTESECDIECVFVELEEKYCN